MLQGVASPRDGAVVRPAAQVPHQLRTLREAGGAEGVALGDQAARGVDEEAAAAGDVAAADQLVGLPRLAQAERVEGDQLVGREAVVELDDADVGRPDPGFLQGGLRRLLRHVEADQVDGAAREQARRVRGEALPRDQHGLLLQVRPRVQEPLRDEDRGRPAVRRRAALQLGEGLVHHGRLQDLL